MDNAVRSREVLVWVYTYGSAPSRFGRGVYKVSPEAATLLEPAGWQRVGRGSSYIYLRAPESQATKRPTARAILPVTADVVALAKRLHDAGKPWKGEVCGCTAHYDPARTEKVRCTVIGFDGPRREGVPILREEVEEYHRCACFNIRGAEHWFLAVDWEEGDGVPPRVFEHKDQIVSEIGPAGMDCDSLH